MPEAGPRKRVLLITQRPDVLGQVYRELDEAGFDVHIAEGDADVHRSLAEHRFELVVIGDTADTGTVFEIYRSTKEMLRSDRAPHAPVILLINPEDRTEAITTLETGPDDFLLLPLNPGVLASRIARTVSAGGTEAEIARIRYADLTIDLRRHIVLCGERETPLPAKQFAILVLLTTKPGRVFSRQEILDGIQDENRHVSKRSVDARIRGLRYNLGACGGLVRTVRSIGYRVD